MKARQAAYATVHGVINQHRTLNTLIAQHKSHTAPADQALYQALVYGTLRQYHAYSHLCAQMMAKPPARPGHPLAIILNLGLCQLLTMNLGDHGVINETVNLAAHNGQIRAKGLINAILRRAQQSGEPNNAPNSISVSDVVLYPAKRQATIKDTPLELTSTEFNLLEVLMRHAGQVVSKETLSIEALDRKLAKFDRSIDVHISSIRHKLGDASLIQTVRGLGYLFVKN